MRKGLILGLLAALSVAGVAYGATTVVNTYKLNARVTPARSGTALKPVPVATHVDFTVGAVPKGDRPNIVKTIDVRIAGLKENTNRFPACGSARLTDPAQGPGTCPAGSQIGKGYFVSEVSTPNNQTKTLITCRAEVTVFNGGNHTLTYYVYKGSPVAGQPVPCPLPRNEAFVATLTSTRAGLVQTMTIPQELRHPSLNGVTYDASLVRAFIDIRSISKTVTRTVRSRAVRTKAGKKARATRTKKVKTRIGLFESVSCPANHQRQVEAKFTQENGRSKTVTRLVRCT